MTALPIPQGWYFCAESREIDPGAVVAKRLFGQNLVLWRTQSGKLNVSHAVCPHLGSDLGKLGRVEGEHLKCFSHDYTYNGGGDCVATGFKTLPCRTQRVLQTRPVDESHGFVLVWHDEKNRPPSWQLDKEVFGGKSSRDFVRSNFAFDVPLEIINEDNFDVGHLYKWHKVHDVKTTPISNDGHRISISHGLKRHSILFDKPLKPPFNKLTPGVDSRYSSTLYGHGLTDSYIDIFNFGIRLHDLIWCTPIDAKRTMYTTFVRLLPSDRAKGGIRRILGAFWRQFIFRMSVYRLRQEHKNEGQGFWERQSKVIAPILTEKEQALIGPYREWCRQFIG